MLPTTGSHTQGTSGILINKGKKIPDPQQGLPLTPLGNSPHPNEEVTPICKFFLNGKCKFNSVCRFVHPKIWRIFKQNGSKKTNGKVETNRVPSFIRMLVEISSKIRPVQEMSADSTILMEPKKLNGKENHTKEIHTTRIIILKWTDLNPKTGLKY